MSAIWNDIRYALRGFRRTSLFTTVAILSLAFGIANGKVYVGTTDGVGVLGLL